MKPTMIFALAMLTMITLMASFDVHLGNVEPTVHVPENLSGEVLYICPVQSNGWDSAADILRTMQTPLWMGVFFALTMLIFVWGWGLYQNLLKDKFNKNLFLKPWGFTKVLFWAIVILLLATNTPNHYRRIHIKNVPGTFVLCESNTPNTWTDIPPLTKNGTWPQPVRYNFVIK